MSILSTARMYFKRTKHLDAPTDLYAHQIRLLDGGELDLESRRGKPTLIVNTASKCGFTPQYEGLQALHDRYREQGFEVIGFPSADFADQELESAEEIGEFCQKNYGVSFPLSEKVSVRAEPSPLWSELAGQPDSGPPAWNFTKYLVGADGRLRARFSTKTKPEDPEIVAAIEAELPQLMFGSVIVAAAVAVAVVMLVTWAASLVLRDVSIVDPVWGFAFVVVGVVAGLTGAGDSGRRVLIAVMVGLWGLRLGGYLSFRKLGEIGTEDRRYAKMRRRQGSRFPLWSLVMIFGLQGLLVLVVSLPVTAAARCSEPLSWTIAFGLVLWAVGVTFETVGDEQLRRFKADPEHQGQVMDRGLWRYTRHPNYFGDACVWWGVWLVALPAGGTWWTFPGPLVMTVLLVRVSGAALLEKDIGERRPAYREYIERTSGFIPRPPKRP